MKSTNTGHRPNASWHSYVLTSWFRLLLVASMVIAQRPLNVDEPAYYYVGCYTARTDLLKESVYAKTPQTCIEICEHQGNKYAVLAAEKCFCANQLEHEEQQDEQLCNTRCQANKAQYCGGVGVHSYYSTTLVNQPAPHNLRLANSTENSLSLEWDSYEPRKLLVVGAGEVMPPEQQIANFVIESQVVQTYSSLPAFLPAKFIVQSTETQFELTDLQPATLYNVSVTAICVDQLNGNCGSALLLASTQVGVPSPVPPQPKILSRADTTLTVELSPLRNDNGPVSKLLIIVERVDDSLSQPFDPQLLGSWQQAQQDGLPYYIAAELDYDRPEDNRTRQFVIGDGKRYGRYRNVQLEKLPGEEKAHVHISLGVVSTLNGVTKTLYTHSTHEQHGSSLDDFSYATFEKGRSSVVALTVTCIIFGSCLLLSLITYFYLRYKTYRARGLGGRNAHEMTLQTPIIERENNGYLVEDELPPTLENFKQQLQAIVEAMELMKRLPRNALRLNVNDVIGEGRYGEIITGKLTSSSGDTSSDCALHVLALDELTATAQAQLLREMRNMAQLRRHEHILDFHGVSASPDWFYLVFEHQPVSLKRRLIESRRAPHSAPVQRITTLSEQLVLQWIYELASAMAYLGSCQVLHRQLCSHSVHITASESKLKLSVFGPLHYVNSNRQQVDLTRWQAPEVLRYQHYSVKSDIWSFGCVAWECCALGGTPYASLASNQQLLDAIRSGSRPAQPAFVYEDLYQLLLNCWQMDPSNRIGFEDVAYSVRQLMTSARHALCFDRSTDSVVTSAATPILDTLPFYLPMLELCN
ncbi:putative tyrosine-protein kinase Wsck [Scaptodrosophila lebanonensis]|uniref:Tyrosine-protein kinase Wsck n=1 Tax=Drosophila lebanonensis TaxID=7225 RepID=A0A6J2TNQ4_DROLE|nr:putative tyrosine-protein kinase Wsck [Scaptodrosophila lebanonensis]